MATQKEQRELRKKFEQKNMNELRSFVLSLKNGYKYPAVPHVLYFPCILTYQWSDRKETEYLNLAVNMIGGVVFFSGANILKKGLVHISFDASLQHYIHLGDEYFIISGSSTKIGDYKVTIAEDRDSEFSPPPGAIRNDGFYVK